MGRTIFLRRVTIAIPISSTVENAIEANRNFSYKVWSVTPRSEEQGHLLKQWEDNESIDFWEQISRKGKSSRIMAAPDTQVQFEDFLKENNIEHELIIENVERFIVFIKSNDSLSRLKSIYRHAEFLNVNAGKKMKMKSVCATWNL